MRVPLEYFTSTSMLYLFDKIRISSLKRGLKHEKE